MPTSKRKNAQTIIDDLHILQRSTLEEVAEAALRSSDEAVSAAEKILSQKRKVLIHCLRCHEDFDPSKSGYSSCTMHDHSGELIECSNSGLDYIHGCCLKSEDSDEPCWIGSHVTEWSEFSTKEKEHWGGSADDENYWLDSELALAWKANSEKDEDSAKCITCKFAGRLEEVELCSTCCTCGGADD
mmetsp:Transcript_433/g.646  ORF Transcript_433/g.646 Transcript_433/m.646 type:complete len:186 (+) Transcript_433:176-733(+)